jgi:GyrI-like small molecule binding domain
MRKVSIIILLVLVVLLGTGIIYFYKKGAFHEPDIKVTTSPAYTIAGVAYEGKMTSKEFGKLFNDAEWMIEKKKLKGTVCGIFYDNPEDASSVIKAFIGVILNDTNQVLPPGYSKRNLAARKVIEAHVKNLYGSPLIYPKINDYAEEHQIKLSQVPSLEVYPPTKEVFVQVPIKE